MLILYSTNGCHLCDKAHTLLARACPSLEFKVVDVAIDDRLVSRYGERIPVLLKTNTGEELAWPFNAEQLSQFMGLTNF